MHESNKSLFNILRIIGTGLFFAVIFAVLYSFTDLSIWASLGIGIALAVSNFWVLTAVMKSLGRSGE